MNMNKFWFACLFVTVTLMSCEKDDDGPESVPVRDRAEQEIEDQVALQEYLETHFYNYEEFENPAANFDYNIAIDTINEANADKTPLIESDLLEEKIITRGGIDYKIYILKVREGESMQPKFSDSTYVSYKGELLNQTTFDSSGNPIWFDLTRTIIGFSQVLTEFRGASGFEVQPDNTVEWNNDYGIGAVFIPSGLGYFANPTGNIPAYSPLVFTFNLFAVNEADHDRDGIPSWMEDINEDTIVGNDDTDGDGGANYIDSDDDGDFIPTRDEIEINAETGEITLTDTDGDGTPDYLDPNI